MTVDSWVIRATLHYSRVFPCDGIEFHQKVIGTIVSLLYTTWSKEFGMNNGHVVLVPFTFLTEGEVQGLVDTFVDFLLTFFMLAVFYP